MFGNGKRDWTNKYELYFAIRFVLSTFLWAAMRKESIAHGTEKKHKDANRRLTTKK